MRGVLVAIPTLNEASRIGPVLDQLRIDLPPDCGVRFLVVDGGSNDGTQAVVRQLAQADARVALLHNPDRLQSAAINLAARHTLPHETRLVRADAHTAYPPGFIASVVAVLSRDDVDAVVVPMDSMGKTCFGRAAAWVSDTPVGSGGSAHRGGRRSGFVDHGHHAAWKLDRFRRAGGYNPGFSHNEDAEFDCRMNRMGMRLWLDAGIRLTYFVRPTPVALFHQYRNYGRGRSRTVRHHPGSMRARQFAVPCAMIAMAAALILAIAVTPLALIVPGLYLAVLALVSVQIALRRRSACGLLAGFAAFVMHLAWSIGFIGGLLTIRERAWNPRAQSWIEPPAGKG
jgi:succinoglycan biosynthesis protein ExoA